MRTFKILFTICLFAFLTAAKFLLPDFLYNAREKFQNLLKQDFLYVERVEALGKEMANGVISTELLEVFERWNTLRKEENPEMTQPELTPETAEITDVI